MKSTAHSRHDLHTRLQHLLEHLAHVLPSQAPIRDFVHHNTLHGFQHLPFPEAIKTAHALNGNDGYWSAKQFRAHYRRGRISQEDLRCVLKADTSLHHDTVVFATPHREVKRGDIYEVVLISSLNPVTPNQFIWQIEENAALSCFQPDVHINQRETLLSQAKANGLIGETAVIQDLWEACMQVLGLEHYLLHPEELINFTPERALRLFGQQVQADGEAGVSDADLKVRKQARHLLDHLLKQIGQPLTLTALLRQLLGVNLLDDIRPSLLQALSAWLDQGLSAWPLDVQKGGFYATWKQLALQDWGAALSGLWDLQEHLNSLPDNAVDTIAAELQRMGIAEEHWMAYLERLALELPGWSGMVLWRHQHPHYDSLQQPIDMLDYLAVRLVMEHVYARQLCRRHWRIDANLSAIRGHFRRYTFEFFVRYCTFQGQLPEYLLNMARQMIMHSRPEKVGDPSWRQLAQMIWTWQQSPPMNPDKAALPYDHGWRLFRLAQHLAMDGQCIRQLDSDSLQGIFSCMQALDAEQSGYLWLQAYERHYREEILCAIASNHQQGDWPDRQLRPLAQAIFCMDDREEGIRRHLEEVNPAIETLGAAAFFNLPINWQGLDDAKPLKLAPVALQPEHTLREVALAGPKLMQRHTQRRNWRLRLKNALYQVTRQHLFSGTLLSLLAAPGALLLMLGRSYAPRRLGLQLQSIERRIDLSVPTRVQLTAIQAKGDRSAEQNQLGYTDEEQTEQIAQFLQAHGLTTGFGKFVLMMGHYSSNQNNPHEAAYGCGACSGRYSGPNARAFAAMANRREVRQRLAERSIIIPADCHFVAAEHDTCNEAIHWTDTDLIPSEQQAVFQSLQADIALAAARSAQERCRKFASAPRKPDLQQAMRHVEMRALDYSQPRPELGHVTNAVALVGRRSLSQGIFLDRRAFLISYDYRDDPDGHILEEVLLVAAPVGAGISLEYYFSTVNNSHYGSGSKIMHNVTGLLGVMEGTASDLRTGLPKQMIEIHEPMRLLLVLEAQRHVVQQVYQRQADLQTLIKNLWVQLAVKEPETGLIYEFHPNTGFVPWHSNVSPLPEVECSADWFSGSQEHLPPALVRSSRSSTRPTPTPERDYQEHSL